MSWYCNTVICVDDEEAVLESYQQILDAWEEEAEIAEILDMAKNRDKGKGPAFPGQGELYTILLADSGQQAVDLVRREIEAGRRVAAGFFDMRMPGLDGYETIKAIRELDPNLICAVVTAYTDRNVRQVRSLFPEEGQDELLYFKKPFNPEELEQAAFNMVSSWNRKRKLEEQVRSIEKHKQGLSQILHAVSILSGVPPHSLKHLVPGFLFQLLAFTEAEHGCTLFWGENDECLTFGVGRFEDQNDLADLFSSSSEFQEALASNTCHIAGNYCFIPLRSGAINLGGVYLESKETDEIIVDPGLLEVFKNQLIQLVLNSLYHQRAVASEQEAVTDPLTGLYNRRFLAKKLGELLQSSHRSGKVAVIVLDLDDFKEVNDTHGHDAGDQVLKKLGALLRLAVRDYDLVGRKVENIGETGQYAVRLGGEEFCLILLNTGVKGATVVAERLRTTIEQHPFRVGATELAMTASIGVTSCCIPQSLTWEPDLVEQLINQADKAMYQAKKQGKNRVLVHADATTPSPAP